MGTRYDKLVRDKVPAHIETNGDTPVTRVLEDSEFKEALLAKLVEEAEEVRETRGNEDELAHEIADVLEVIYTLIETFGLDSENIEEKRVAKNEEKGSYDERVFLEEVE